MSVTNAAAASARNSQTGIESSTLDLGLESVVVLKRHGKFSLKTIVSASSIHGWLESSPKEGEQWLRESAQGGDLYAMEKLGRRLLNGDGLTKSVDEGLGWLRKSAELGNSFAMEKLAEYELDANEGPNSTAEGERWLRKAVEHGNRFATISLGSRLMTGDGLVPDPEQAEHVLCVAARQGSQIAIIKLGIYLLSGWGLTRNQEEGLRWLRLAGAINADQLLELGLHLYKKSVAGTTKARRGLAREASVLFQEALRRGNPIAALNLAYLLRRGEIADASCPPLQELLCEPVKQRDSFALVNQALRLAKGIQCSINWEAADALFVKLQDSGNVLEWWFARSQEGDPEGDLVTGWLSRHHLAVDPTGFHVAQRMDLARQGGWPVPEWMNYPATVKQNA
jgi:TPR repeat protein